MASAQESNATLKLKFRKLHDKLVRLDLSPVIDKLFGSLVITLANKQELNRIRNPTERSEQLLMLLHESPHPKAFIKLRDALQQLRLEPAYSELVRELDRLQLDDEEQRLYVDLKACALSTAKVPEDSNVSRISSNIGQITSAAVENKTLKAKFRKLQTTLVDSVEPFRIINVLFQEAVIGETDMRTLQRIKDNPQQQCSELLALLHTSQHPAAFVQLYRAIKDEPSLRSWLVGRIDKLTVDDPVLVDLVQQYYVKEPKVGAKLHSLPRGEPVFGVTSLRDLLYVIRDGAAESEAVEVYDTDTFNLQRYLTVPGLHYVTDLTSCEHNSCLYVADSIAKAVVRVDLTGTVTQWPVGDKPWGLSVNTAHNVVVTCNEAGKVKEFSCFGALLCDVTLPNDTTHPYHTIQLTNGQFIVCHGKKDYQIYRVCVLSPDGRQIIRSHAQDPNTGFTTEATHLAVDRNEFIFVADTGNRRVSLFSPTLTLQRHVVTSDQLHGLADLLCLDADRRRLYVADNKYSNDLPISGQVVVFSV